jgi:hypothetical protein
MVAMEEGVWARGDAPFDMLVAASLRGWRTRPQNAEASEIFLRNPHFGRLKKLLKYLLP